MADDGDRHVLGDPVTRMMNGPSDPLDDTPVAELDETELRRQISNLELMIREADERGTPPSAVARLRDRLQQVAAEYDLRSANPAAGTESQYPARDADG